MALDPFLLEILVCPETRAPVRQLSALATEKLNTLIREGKIKNRAGTVVTEAVESGLLRADGQILYPVRSDIPVLLTDEGFVLDGIQLPA